MIAVIKNYIAANAHPLASNPIRGESLNYKTWLNDTYGKTFADTFPIVYGQKYHAISMDSLTPDWIGPWKPQTDLEEILPTRTPRINEVGHEKLARRRKPPWHWGSHRALGSNLREWATSAADTHRAGCIVLV